MSWCKTCCSAVAAQRYADKREHINKVNARWKAENSEKNRAINAEWKRKNADRVSEAGKAWYKANSDRKKELHRKWYKENKESVCLRAERWHKENRDKVVECCRRAGAARRATPRGKLENNLSSDICKSLRGKKAGTSWQALVGFTCDDLKRHLEKQFHGGMSWDNYGKLWEIDHIIPKIAFNFESPQDIDFKRCWSLSNLRPLEVSENRIKNGRLSAPFQPSLLLEVA
jgi:hypothetical protein